MCSRADFPPYTDRAWQRDRYRDQIKSDAYHHAKARELRRVTALVDYIDTTPRADWAVLHRLDRLIGQAHRLTQALR